MRPASKHYANLAATVKDTPRSCLTESVIVEADLILGAESAHRDNGATTGARHHATGVHSSGVRAPRSGAVSGDEREPGQRGDRLNRGRVRIASANLTHLGYLPVLCR
jgi:hypothetical protein